MFLTVLAFSSGWGISGVINFSTPVTVSGDTDVMNAGASVFAYDVTGAGRDGQWHLFCRLWKRRDREQPGRSLRRLPHREQRLPATCLRPTRPY